MRTRKDVTQGSRERVAPQTVTQTLAPASGYSGYIPRPLTRLTSPWRLARLYMYYDDDEKVHTWKEKFPYFYTKTGAFFQRD